MPDINAAAFLMKTGFPPFTFNLLMSLDIKCVHCRQRIVEFGHFIGYDTLPFVEMLNILPLCVTVGTIVGTLSILLFHFPYVSIC